MPAAAGGPVHEVTGQLAAGGIDIITARLAGDGDDAGTVQQFEKAVDSCRRTASIAGIRERIVSQCGAKNGVGMEE